LIAQRQSYDRLNIPRNASQEIVDKQKIYDDKLNNIKKITSYNIISNQSSPVYTTDKSRIPKGYFINHDPGKLEAITLFNNEKQITSQQKFEKNMDQFFGASNEVYLPETK
jgi:hypothetical protein